MEQNLLECISKTIEDKINEQYTEYKNKCLEDLDLKIEMKRNEIISGILDNIAISIERQEKSLNPAINIRVETRPIIKIGGNSNG